MIEKKGTRGFRRTANVATALAAVALFAATALLITSCGRSPQSAESPLARAAASTIPPQLDLQTPADLAFYPFTVQLAGTVTAGTYRGKTDPIVSIKYRIADTPIAGSAAPGANGSFAARLTTAGVRGDLILTVTAVSDGGERTDRTIRLRDHAAGPYIGIDSPRPGSAYEKTIPVAGWVRSSLDLRSTDDVAGLEYRAVPLTYAATAGTAADRSGWTRIQYAANGYFAFDEDASRFRGPVNLYFRATDRNGRVSSIVRRITQLTAAPLVVVDTPANGSRYGRVIRVVGRIETTDGAQPPRTVSSIRWIVESSAGSGAGPASSVSGTAEVREGEFSFAVPTDGMTGPVDLIVSAESSEQLRSQVLVSLLGGPGKLQETLPLALPQEKENVPALATAPAVAPQKPEPKRPPEAKPQQEPAAVVPPKIVERPAPRNETATEGGPKPPAVEPAPIAAVPLAPVRPASKAAAAEPAPAKPVVSVAQAGAAPAADIRPVITVTTPGPRSFYKTEIYVEGKVNDNPNDPASVQNIRSFTYGLEDRPAVKGAVNWDYVDGSFWFSFPSRGLSGTHTLVLTATDATGRKEIKRLTLYDGNTAPEVGIAGPGDQSTYGSRLWIHGKILDPSEDLGQPRGITDATYYVYPSDFLSEFQGYRGKLELDKVGNFSLLVLTGEFDGSEVIEISATSVNGNSTTQRVTVDRAQAEIPTFAVKSGNSSAVLSWNRVPLASSYDLYYTDDGTEPGPKKGRILSRVSAPVTISGLKNGYRYTFMVGAHAPAVLPGDRVEPNPDSDGGRQQYQVIGKPAGDPTADVTLLSAPVIGIPLAPETLRPAVRGEYGKIALSWEDIPGTDDFAVLRSESESGPFLQIAHVTGAHSYVDSEVRYGRAYYYRVSPAYPGSIASVPISGTTTPLPPSPFLLAGTADDPNARSVALVGNYAAVATGDEFSVVDVYDPHQPRVVGKIALTGAQALAVDGTTVFAAAGARGVKIVDVTDPAHPRLAGSWATGNAVGVAVVRDGSNRVVYIADGKGGLKMLSGVGEQNGGSVTTVSRDEADTLAVLVPASEAGNSAPLLCAGGQSGLTVYSLATIDSPRRIFTDGSSAVSALAGYSGYGRYVVATVGGGELRLYDLHGAPHLTGSTRASGNRISIADTADAQIYAFVVQDASTIASYDLSDPAHPTLFDAFSSPGAMSVQVARDVTGRQYAYVADSAGLKILDVFNIGQSLRISKIGISDRPLDVAVVARSGKPLLALVANTGAEVRIFDAANPFDAGPRSLEGVLPANDARSLTVATDAHGRPLVYVANGASGVDLYDLTPVVLKAESGKGTASAQLLGSFNTNGTVRSVAAGSTDGRLYVADAKTGMIVLDMSDPKQTRELGAYPSTDARQVAADGSYVFLADYAEGLVVLDVRDPAHPKRIAGIAGLRARAIALYRGAGGKTYACVVGLNGISLVNVSDPAHPALSGVYATDSAENLKIAGSYAYVAEGYRGLSVLDLANPERVRKVSTSDLQYAGAVDVSGDFAFVTDPEGLNIVQILIPDWITEARGK